MEVETVLPMVPLLLEKPFAMVTVVKPLVFVMRIVKPKTAATVPRTRAALIFGSSLNPLQEVTLCHASLLH